jgi:glycosyltransferase involved in cell wall biosynthesis
MKILHIFRSPIGGLFRHVVDLALGQLAAGHKVGFIFDSSITNPRADIVLADLTPRLTLGVSRVPMKRQPGLSDVATLWRISQIMCQADVDVVHGHGAKGGALARLGWANNPIVRAYTPHGGSLHDQQGGYFHLAIERLLMPLGNLYLFESRYSYDAFLRKVGTPQSVVRIIPNGVGERDFAPIPVADSATDIVFLGELRFLKGVDVLIDAIALLRQTGISVTATIIGNGPDQNDLYHQVSQLGLNDLIEFCEALPARTALGLGRVVVVPSRAESLPYVVLEAAAAGKPIIATNVGGIPEIFGALAGKLVNAGDRNALAEAISNRIKHCRGAEQDAVNLRTHVAAKFSVNSMVNNILAAYEVAADNIENVKRQPAWFSHKNAIRPRN